MEGKIMITTIRVKRTKTIGQISEQVERIYKLYGQGYGSHKMIDDVDEKVYVTIVAIKY